MGFQFQSIASVSPLLVRELDIDMAALGVLVGAWMLPGVAVALPGGVLARRFGDKSVALLGLSVMVLGSVVVAAAADYRAAVAGRVISGTGAVLLNVLVTKMVADWFAHRELATAMALLVTSWPLGIGLALLVLGPLGAATSWSFAVEITAWVCGAAWLLVALIYRRPAAQRASPEAPTPPSSWRITRPELQLAFVAGLIWTLYNVGYIIVVSFSPILLVQKGLGAAGAALVASFATWPLVATIPIGGLLADRTGRGHGIMVSCFLAMAAMMPFMLAAPSPLVLLAVVGALAGPAAGIIMALPARVLSPGCRHVGMGIYFSLYYLGMAVLPGAAGWLRGVTETDSAPLAFGSALLVGAALCAVLFRSLERRQAVPGP